MLRPLSLAVVTAIVASTLLIPAIHALSPSAPRAPGWIPAPPGGAAPLKRMVLVAQPHLRVEKAKPVLRGSASSRYQSLVKGFWSWQDYPWWIPPTKPIKVVLVKNVPFGNWSWGKGPKRFVIDLTKIRGEFSRILMKVSVVLRSSVKGWPAVNYDRPLWIWIDGVPVFIGTTAQRFNYTVTVDVTPFYNLIVGKKLNLSIFLYNSVLPKYHLTGVFYVTVELLLYPGKKPSGVPDEWIPLWVPTKGPFRGVSFARSTHGKGPSETIVIPRGVSRAVLLMYTEGCAYEEFWYDMIPPDRYMIVASDGKPIAIAQPYPYIFTGGIDPLLWRPVTAIRTYAFSPLVMDLTGLLPLLVGKHTISLHIYNGGRRWYVFAAIALYTHPRAVSYRLVSYRVVGPRVLFSRLGVSGHEHGVALYTYVRQSMAAIYAVSEIKLVGHREPLYAYTKIVNEFLQIHRFDATWTWDNSSTIQLWNYTTVYSPTVFRTASYVARSLLKIKYGFLVHPLGNIFKASVKHPVYAKFTLWVRILMVLNERRSTPFTETVRLYRGFVNSYGYIKGKLAFLGPTAALLVAITGFYSDTHKMVYGLEETPSGKVLSLFTRICRGVVTPRPPVYRLALNYVMALG